MLQQPPPALTAAQVEEKLRSIPVFTITDSRGAPMLAHPTGAKKPVTYVYISPAGAKGFLETLTKSRPELAGKVRVTTVSLVEIYRLARRADAPFLCQFVADPKDMAAAKPLLAKGQQVMAPMFAGRSAERNGLLTIKHEGQEILPLYFSKADLDDVIAKLSGTKGAPKDLKVEVMDLPAVLSMLTTSPDKSVARLILVPTRAAADYVQAQGKAPGKP